MRGLGKLGVALVLLVVARAPGAAASAPPTLSIRLPSSGNVSVTRVTIVPAAGSRRVSAAPRLTVVRASALPASLSVVAGITRDSTRASRFVATIALLDRPAEGAVPSSAGASGTMALRVSSGYVFRAAQTASDVLYLNAMPRFAVRGAAVASALAGRAAPKLSPARVLLDAQKLAVEQNVPVAEMALLGYPYISAGLTRAAGRATAYSLTVGVANLGSVNAIELAFPPGSTLAHVSGPPEVGPTPAGRKLQLFASQGFFQQGVTHTIALEFDRALPRGSFFTLRASTHYFENVLPFSERFVVPV